MDKRDNEAGRTSPPISEDGSDLPQNDQSLDSPPTYDQATRSFPLGQAAGLFPKEAESEGSSESELT